MNHRASVLLLVALAATIFGQSNPQVQRHTNVSDGVLSAAVAALVPVEKRVGWTPRRTDIVRGSAYWLALYSHLRIRRPDWPYPSPEEKLIGKATAVIMTLVSPLGKDKNDNDSLRIQFSFCSSDPMADKAYASRPYGANGDPRLTEGSPSGATIGDQSNYFLHDGLKAPMLRIRSRLGNDVVDVQLTKGTYLRIQDKKQVWHPLTQSDIDFAVQVAQTAVQKMAAFRKAGKV